MTRRPLTTAAALSLIVLAILCAARPLDAQRGGPAPSVLNPPERLTAQSDGHPMAVWARHPAPPATARGSVLLVHGLTWSGRPDFDLQVPGMGLQRSVLASLAANGFHAYAIDLRGYGETPRDNTGWLTPTRAAKDIANVLGWIAQQNPRLPPPALVGWSRGAAISMLTAQQAPNRLSALVLFGFVFDPDAKFLDTETVPEKPQRDLNTRDNAASDFISPEVTTPAVVNAFVDQALKADPVHIDLKGDPEYNLLKVAKVTVPTLVLYGERDPGVSFDEAGKFFAKLGTVDRQMVVIPGADHCAHLEDTHDKWIAAVAGFLTRPPLKR
jgi:pimeloyl-ACP methyl ester carboxylesterase